MSSFALVAESGFDLTDFESHIESAVDLAQQIALVDKTSALEAVNYIAEIRKLKKQIESRKLEITATARTFVSEVNAVAKSLITRLENAVEDIEHKLFLWKEDEAKRSTVQSFFCEELGEDLTMDTSQDTSILRSSGCTAYERDVWRYEIVDYREVPIDYLEVNDTSVKLAIKNGIRSIPGLKIFRETKTTFRSK